MEVFPTDVGGELHAAEGYEPYGSCNELDVCIPEASLHMAVTIRLEAPASQQVTIADPSSLSMYVFGLRNRPLQHRPGTAHDCKATSRVPCIPTANRMVLIIEISADATFGSR